MLCPVRPAPSVMSCPALPDQTSPRLLARTNPVYSVTWRRHPSLPPGVFSQVPTCLSLTNYLGLPNLQHASFSQLMFERFSPECTYNRCEIVFVAFLFKYWWFGKVVRDACVFQATTPARKTRFIVAKNNISNYVKNDSSRLLFSKMTKCTLMLQNAHNLSNYTERQVITTDTAKAHKTKPSAAFRTGWL